MWEDIVKLRQGLVLLTGTTGAGKSTTIAALLNRIAQTRACHIITLEDPIEYEFDSDIAMVSQRAVGRDVRTMSAACATACAKTPTSSFVAR